VPRPLSPRAFEQLVSAAPDGIVVVDAEGLIRFVNAQLLQMLGYEANELLGRPVEMLVPEGLRAAHVRHRAAYRTAPRTRPMGSNVELVARRRDGTELPVEISLSLLRSGAGMLVTAILRDVSERRRAAEALRESEERYRLLAENAQDLIYRVALGPPLRVEYVSPSIRFTGYTPNDLYEDAELLFALVHPGDRDFARTALADPDHLPGPITVRFGARDGTISWQEHRLVVMRDAAGRPQAIEGIARDITDRLRVEEERRILLADSEMQRERERIAADIHDGVMQSIYGVGLSLRRAATEVGDDHPEVRERLQEAIDELRGAIADIRRYVMDLRPLRFTGDLARSLTDVVTLFEASSGITVKLDVERVPSLVDEERALALFHIAREALSNVRRHSRATIVTVLLAPAEGGVLLRIADDGVGFDAGQPRDGHFGLGNMEMRARTAGGRLSIESRPGRGTRVEAFVPLDSD